VKMAPMREALTTAGSQLVTAQRELEDAHTELRAPRNEEQRAAMIGDELRAAKAELESGQASHRADLFEREAELEEKVRATREEFQRQLEEIEASYRSQLEQREAELHGRVTDAETAARTAVPDLQAVREEVQAAPGA